MRNLDFYSARVIFKMYLLSFAHASSRLAVDFAYIGCAL